MSERRVTSADVAAAAGVSRATVSYVLNGASGRRISPTTAARVLDAAERLGYVPHGMASALRAGRTTIVLLAFPAWPLGPPMADAIAAAVGELEGLGYTPLVHFAQPGDPDGLRRACERTQPVGVIAPAAALSAERVAALRRNGTRGILALARAPVDGVPAFAFDQAAVGRLALEHLAGRGHRRVLILLPEAAAFAGLAAERRAGAEAAARRRGMGVTCVRADADAVDGVLGPALAGADPPTALFAFNDELALAAIATLGDGGVSVPRDLAVVGCDDSPAARHARPRLTTIELVAPETWRAVARGLHAAITGEPVDPPAGAPRLVQGGTT